MENSPPKSLLLVLTNQERWSKKAQASLITLDITLTGQSMHKLPRLRIFSQPWAPNGQFLQTLRSMDLLVSPVFISSTVLRTVEVFTVQVVSSFNQLCNLVRVGVLTTLSFGMNGISLLISLMETVEPIAVREFTLRQVMLSTVQWSKLTKSRTLGKSLLSERRPVKPPHTLVFLEQNIQLTPLTWPSKVWSFTIAKPGQLARELSSLTMFLSMVTAKSSVVKLGTQESDTLNAAKASLKKRAETLSWVTIHPCEVQIFTDHKIKLKYS